MPYNQLEDRYLNSLAELDFPTMPPARLPEVVVTGEPEPPAAGGPAGLPEPRFGRGGVTKAQAEAAGGLEKPAMALADTLAGALRGTVAQSLGLPGDIESLVRLLTGGEQVLPTTERVSEMLPPVVPPGAPNAAARQQTAEIAGKLGEFNPIVGAPEAVKLGVKGVKELAPVAGQMAEDYLRRTGGLMNVAPPRVDSIDKFPIGPGSIKPRVIAQDKPLHREMSVDNLMDFLRNDKQFAYAPVFVTDNADLAIGQGSNAGVKVKFRANSVSGEEHRKPMTGDIAGREYQADVFAPMAIESIIFASEADLKKVKSVAARVLQTDFERVTDGKKNIVFVRKVQGEEKK